MTTSDNNISTSNEINVSDAITCALQYAKNGFHVFPVVKGKKIPKTTNGMNDATNDPEIIRKIFSPDDNVGINCIKSGIVVIDIDNSDGKSGSVEFKNVVMRCNGGTEHVPDTAGQRSARNGVHLVYKVNQDLIDACGDGLPKNLCKDVDIKYKGYIVAEPSTFGDGKYLWIRNSPLSEEFSFEYSIVDMPNWMIREIIRVKYPRNGDGEQKLYKQDAFASGNRHNGLMSEAGRLRRVIDDYDTLFVALKQINQKKCDPPVDDDELRNIVGSVIQYTPQHPIVAPNDQVVAEDSTRFGIYYDNGNIQRPNYPTIGDYLIEKWHCVVYSGEIYIYDPVLKLYRPNQSNIESDVIDICVNKIDWNKNIIEPQRQVISYISNNSAINHTEYPFNRPEDGISVRNGVVRIDDGKIVFEESSPNHLFTYRLNVEYNANADREPVREMFRTLANGNEQTFQALYDIPAQAILQMQQMVFKRAYLLVGPPHTGKSTLMDLYKKMFGHGNISGVQLQNLENRWSAAAMENKLLNAYDDLSPLKMSDTTAFKTFTGTAFHEVEQKFKSTHTGLVNPVHVFSANCPPFVPAHAYNDDGFWIRWGLIEFSHVFTKKPNFGSMMLCDANISGFFNDVLDTVVTIMQNGYNLTLGDDWEGVRDKWMYLSNDMYRFIHDHTEVDTTVDTNKMATLSELYDLYVKYLTKTRRGMRFTLPTQEAFGTKLSQEFGMSLSQCRVTTPGGFTERRRIYYGIVMKR